MYDDGPAIQQQKQTTHSAGEEEQGIRALGIDRSSSIVLPQHYTGENNGTLHYPPRVLHSGLVHYNPNM